MNSKVYKAGVIAAFFLLSHCNNTTSPITTIHPLMNLAEEQQNNTSRVIISTTVAKDYSMYRIIDDSCTLKYPWTAKAADSSDSAYIAIVKIANDSVASQSGTFHGIWAVPDSLFKYGPFQINAYLLDATNHSVYDTLTVHGPFPPPQ